MFPIPSERTLSVFDVAEYWSREITPVASARELRDVISRAWWRGELAATNGLSRLSILRAYYLGSAKFIAFVIPDAEEAPQWESVNEDVIELVRPLRVPLPSSNPETWTDANCAAAFDAIAEQWKEAIISASLPLFLDITLTSNVFFQWVDACGYKHPTFWSDPLEKSDRPVDQPIPSIVISNERPKSKKSGAAWDAINCMWPDGPAENLETSRIHRQVNKWISKQHRTKYPFTEVSREVVARLLGRK